MEKKNNGEELNPQKKNLKNNILSPKMTNRKQINKRKSVKFSNFNLFAGEKEVQNDSNIETKQKQKSKVVKFIENANTYLNGAFFVFILRAILLDLLLSIYINFWFLRGLNKWVSLNWGISVIILIGHLISIVYVLTILIRLENARHDKVLSTHLKTIFKYWLQLRDNIREDLGPIHRFTPEILSFLDYFLCLAVVGGYNNANYQLIPLILIKLITVVILMKRSFEDILEWILALFNEVLILITVVVFFIYHIYDKDLTEEQRYSQFGNGMILCFLLLIIMNIVIGLIQMIISAIEACKKKKQAEEKESESKEQSQSKKGIQSKKIISGEKLRIELKKIGVIIDESQMENNLNKLKKKTGDLSLNLSNI